VPSTPWNARGLGGLQELERGDALPISSIEPILRSLELRGLHAVALDGVAPAAPAAVASTPAEERAPRDRGARASPSSAQPRPRAAAENEMERALLEAIDAGVRYPMELALALSLGVGEVSHALLLLTLRGLVRNDAGVLSRIRP
jgi:DprA winged helix domain